MDSKDPRILVFRPILDSLSVVDMAAWEKCSRQQSQHHAIHSATRSINKFVSILVAVLVYMDSGT